MSKNSANQTCSTNHGDPELEKFAFIDAQLEKARDLVTEGKQEEALRTCTDVLKQGDLPIQSASTLARIVRHLGQDEMADQITSVLIEGIRKNLESLSQSTPNLIIAAQSLADLEKFDDAKQLSDLARPTVINDVHLTTSYCSLMVSMDYEKDAFSAATEFIKGKPDQFEIAIHFAMVFAHLDCRESARHFLFHAREHVTSKSQRAQLNYQLAAHGYPVDDLDQHAMAVELFDNFADTYDEQLKLLENNGPSLLYSVLEDLNIPKNGTRRILDAGCGTGLCAPFLRPYANEVFGVDLSVSMLEKAKSKSVYDYLARTDLSVAATYPEGTFDMIVSSDVLVYVGALDTVFDNFQTILKPGGWLLITVETETDPKRANGFRLYSSGRYKHSDGYLLDTLAQTGFPKPKILTHARLRDEMAKPILGTVLAVQKPAFLTG
ncbi:Predicted methyltransferase, contains TPR repeat [Marivita hallyeonensis]|uniref:Predicted methyltransferase, contains TPR repeat n=1 Tax=Marivita hallyeonensis TaxID=996342 RepID=A0A1M5WB34_9RHOB|nr:Predicted methyltransferase, contains TPR repeat [Marivita hallyeonensis]